LFWP